MKVTKVKKEYFEILLEDISGKVNALAEGHGMILTMSERLERMDTRLESVEVDIKIIKSVVTEHSHDIDALKAIHPNLQHSH